MSAHQDDFLGQERELRENRSSDSTERGKNAPGDGSPSDNKDVKACSFSPISVLGTGEKCGHLLCRRSFFEKEWKWRWCVLKETGIFHAASPIDVQDVKFVPFAQASVKPNSFDTSDGHFFGFELDAPSEVLQLCVDTEELANEWVEMIDERVSIASENDPFHISETMIQDGQKAISTNDEMLVNISLESLQGLVSTHAGADSLLRFARSTYSSDQRRVNEKLLIVYLDLERAIKVFLSGNNGKKKTMLSSKKPYSNPIWSSVKLDSRIKFSETSPHSQAGRPVTSPAPEYAYFDVLSRKEWIIRLCDQFLDLRFSFLENLSIDGVVESEDSQFDEEEISKLFINVENLRSIILKDEIRLIPRKRFVDLLISIRDLVYRKLDRSLYSKFVASKRYEEIVASIPARVHVGRLEW